MGIFVKTQDKIDANDKTLSQLLDRQKFYIDYFQREYRWGKKHIELLVEDLTATFEKSYDHAHDRPAVENYQNYYLGPVVFSEDLADGKKSIIDGQQRITSITLLLIYLHHLQSGSDDRVSVENLIYSEKYGRKSFNMTEETREPCLQSLYKNGSYEAKEDDDETVINMAERYDNIAQSLELDERALPFFVDWLLNKVVFVEIVAYSEENAYTIFETMNDRGLNLTSTEMLKGYVLSKISDSKKRLEIDAIWKKQIQKLHEYGETADQTFFQSWFRGKYAVSMRPGKAGAENQDFELIGTKFHSWFKDNHKKLFELEKSEDFYNYFKEQFPFYVKLTSQIWDAQEEFNSKIPHLHYVQYWGIAESLQDPLLVASVTFNDDPEKIWKKLDYVARYIETFTVRRSANSKKFGQTSIRYTMFNLMKEIRDKSPDAVATTLSTEIGHIEQKWDGVPNFRMHGHNKRFVKHLLSRISGYMDELVGGSTNYVTYHHPSAGKPFEIEHLLGAKFDDYKDDDEYKAGFEHESDFHEWRNAIGALVLLPNGKNQSYGSDKYEEKLKHYIKENAYVQTLHKKFYEKNPDFLRKNKKLGFQCHAHLTKKDIEKRNELVKRVCEEIWSTKHFG